MTAVLASPMRVANGLALLAGIGLVALVLLTSWRAPEGGTVPGVDLRVSATPTGELTFEQGTLLEVHDLRPSLGSNSADAELGIRNEAGRDLAVRVKALPATGDLDRELNMSIAVAGKTIASGPIGSLERWSRNVFIVSHGASQTLRLRAWLAPSSSTAFNARIADVDLAFRTEAVGA